jgi:hypothetical protein
VSDFLCPIIDRSIISDASVCAHWSGSHCSSVSIVTSLRVGRPELYSGQGLGYFLPTITPTPALGPTQSLIHRKLGGGVVSPGLKRSEHEDN